MNKFTAIVLAAGSGKRMEQEIPKQYMKIGDAPLMVHCLRTFQENLKLLMQLRPQPAILSANLKVTAFSQRSVHAQ